MAETASTKTPLPTRMRILAACRSLFNERGPGEVTTAQIAAAVGINEGNLYYHFKRKEQILEALFEQYEANLREVASANRDYVEDPQRHGEYLRGWFNLMWEWRFFYRDIGLIARHAPSLHSQVQELSDYGQAQVRLMLETQARAGLIAAPPEEIDRLVVNAWIIATYWIDYLRLRHGVTELTRGHIRWGAEQVGSLFVPYLTPAGRKILTGQQA
jgi:AcrR family transcriptional regulator